VAGLTWIKLNIDMFDNKKIKQIRKMPGGNDMVLFWVMLLSLAGKSNSQGYILFTESIPYTPEMLANEFDIPINTVKMALDLFIRFNMISINEEVITITGWAEYQNVDGIEKIKQREQARLRKQKQREKEKFLIGPTKDEVGAERDMSRDGERDITRDPSYIERENKNIDKEKEIEKENFSLIDEAIEVCKYFEAVTNGKSVTQHMNEIKLLIELYSKSWLLEAIDISISKNIYSLNYAKTILKNWLNDGKAKKPQENEASVKPTAYKPFQFED
jgi:predicted phage replisome organizer